MLQCLSRRPCRASKPWQLARTARIHSPQSRWLRLANCILKQSDRHATAATGMNSYATAMQQLQQPCSSRGRNERAARATPQKFRFRCGHVWICFQLYHMQANDQQAGFVLRPRWQLGSSWVSTDQCPPLGAYLTQLMPLRQTQHSIITTIFVRSNIIHWLYKQARPLSRAASNSTAAHAPKHICTQSNLL